MSPLPPTEKNLAKYPWLGRFVLWSNVLHVLYTENSPLFFRVKPCSEQEISRKFCNWLTGSLLSPDRPFAIPGIDISGKQMHVWQMLIIGWNILHVMALAMNECFQVVKGLTVSLRINSSALICKAWASGYRGNWHTCSLLKWMKISNLIWTTN